MKNHQKKNFFVIGRDNLGRKKSRGNFGTEPEVGAKIGIWTGIFFRFFSEDLKNFKLAEMRRFFSQNILKKV